MSKMLRAYFLLLFVGLFGFGQSAGTVLSTQSQPPLAVANQMVSSLPVIAGRSYSPSGMGADSIVAYSKGVRESFDKGFMQLPMFAYGAASRPNTGLEDWSRTWGDETRRLGASFSSDGPLAAVVAAKGLPGLYKNGRPDSAMAQRYLERLKSLSAELVDQWSEALNKPHRGILVHLMVQHDPLFSGSALSQAGVTSQLQMLRTIPTESVDAWVDASVYPREEAILCMLRVPALFPNNRFDKTLFDAAIPLAKKMLVEQAPK